jgi:gamma-glutamyltranspeptidase/glutathione hydrolase
LGSDAFAILWDGKELHGLNSSGPAPATWTPEYFHRKYGAETKTPPKRGFDSVTVPGAVAGWVALSDRFGKLPFADLLEPAIEVAERGYLIPVVVQQKWAAATPELQSQPGFAQSFLPWGRAPQVGELFQFKNAARGLKAIAATKGQALYGGEIAHAIEKFAKDNGGSITAKDLADFKPEWVKPMAQDYRGYTLHEIPPNGQGIAALIALGILSNFDMANLLKTWAEISMGRNANIGRLNFAIDKTNSMLRGMRVNMARQYRLLSKEDREALVGDPFFQRIVGGSPQAPREEDLEPVTP